MFVKTTQSKHARFAKNPAVRRQRGDTMIEVLVTMVIIAVGVLGTAALQVTTLKNLSSSHSASVAALVANDFSERMRANPTAALNNDYVHDSLPNTQTDCVGNACTPDQLANYDMEVWWQEMTLVLPSAKGVVERIVGTDTFSVTVHWDEDRSGSSNTACPPQSEDDLECYQFNVTPSI
jgi:type IV pilus assembly protein PilV